MPSPEFLTDAPDFYVPGEVIRALHQHSFEEEAIQLGVVKGTAYGLDIGLEGEIELMGDLLEMRALRNVAPGELGTDYYDLLDRHSDELLEHAQMASEFLLSYPGFVVMRRMTEKTLDFYEPRLVVVTDGCSRHPRLSASLALEASNGEVLELDPQTELLCDVAKLPDGMQALIKPELRIPQELTPLW